MRSRERIFPGMDFGVERKAASTAVFVAVTKNCGSIRAIRLNEENPPLKAIRELQGEGLRIVILTGDHKGAAKVIATSWGSEKWKEKFCPGKRLKS